MPVERNEIDPEVFGSLNDIVLDMLEDGKGYYFEEMLETFKCNEKSLYRALAELQSMELIRAKTMPKKGTKHKKVYYLRTVFDHETL